VWIVDLAFTHGPERLAARKAHRQELTELHEEGIVWQAGSLADDDAAVIVFDVPDRSRLAELAALDPASAPLASPPSRFARGTPSSP